MQMLLVVAVAAIAGTTGFLAAGVLQGQKRRARRFFVLGFVCGVTAGAVLKFRRRGLRAFGALYSGDKSLTWIGTRYHVAHAVVADTIGRRSVQLRPRPSSRWPQIRPTLYRGFPRRASISGIPLCVTDKSPGDVWRRSRVHR